MIKRIVFVNSFPKAIKQAREDRKKERGAILLISIMLLLVMTLIGVATFENSITEEKISGNIVNVSEARFAADVATRMAVAWLNSLQVKPTTCKTSPCCNNCVWERGALTTEPFKQTACWWQGTAGGAGCSGTANGIYVSGVAAVKNQPQYVIEESNCNETLRLRTYRVTARGTGVTTTNPPVVVNTMEYDLPLPPPAYIFYNYSADIGAVGVHVVTNTVTMTTTGSLVGIWIGTNCWTQTMNVKVVLSIPGKSSASYDLTLSPPSNSVSGGFFCARCNMGHGVFPTPYPVKSGENLTVQVTSTGGACTDNFQTTCGWNGCVGAFRMTLDGVSTFCN